MKLIKIICIATILGNYILTDQDLIVRAVDDTKETATSSQLLKDKQLKQEVNSSEEHHEETTKESSEEVKSSSEEPSENQSSSVINKDKEEVEESIEKMEQHTTTSEESTTTSNDERISQNGWTYQHIGDFAYITSCSLSGDITVPSILGGKPIRFVNLNSSIFNNYKQITSISIPSGFSVGSISFEGFEKLESVNLNLQSIETNSMANMFNGLINLKTVNFNNFDAASITNMDSMFYGASSLVNIDLSRFNTSNVTTMRAMFYGASSLTNIDLSKFDTSSVTNMAFMFSGCQKLTSLDLSNFNTNNVANMAAMFQATESLTSLNLLNFNTSRVKDMSYMFSGCTNLSSLNLSSFNTSSVTNMAVMFRGAQNLTNLNLSNFNTSSVTDMTQMFDNCRNLSSLNLSSFDTSNVTNMRYMFNNCYKLPNLNVSNFSTSKVVDMNSMFGNCREITSLDLSNFDTSNVTDMAFMFSECGNLRNLNISNFNTSNVTNMAAMFQLASSIIDIDVSSFNTSKVTSMNYMFAYVSTRELDLSNFDTSNVVNMYAMFQNARQLSNLNLSSFDVSNVTNMSYMFYQCPNLVNIDLSSFNYISDSTEMNFMFYTSPQMYLVVRTNNDKLLNYNYVKDQRTFAGPRFNPNGGIFPDGSVNTKFYFSKIAVTPTEYTSMMDLSSFKAYLKTIMPTKDNNLFSNWTDNSGNNIDNITDVPRIIGNTYHANWRDITPPNPPEGSIPPESVNPVAKLGIAYFPKQWIIPDTPLSNSGKQSITIPTDSLHVGVKDISASTSWTLTAQLNWDNQEFSDSYIQSSNNGKVMKNENNGNDSFVDSDLKDTTEVTGSIFPIINNTPSQIMTASEESRVGVYDYSLDKLTLIIPETKQTKPGQYSGSIKWNLITAP